LVHIKDIYEISKINFAESMTSMSFLAEKKLIIIDYKNKEKKENESINDENLDEYII
jgi:hypothetical protein